MARRIREAPAGEIDAAIVDLRAFDAWRMRNGADGLALTGYAHSLGSNMGFVGLASDRPLIDDATAAIAALQASATIAPLCARGGSDHVPPREPAVQPPVHPDALAGD